MTDMRMRADPSSKYPGRTYRFYKGKSVYPFGYGLSYSKYMYQFTSVNQKLDLTQLSTSSAAKTSDSIRYTLVSNIDSYSCEKAKFSAKVGVSNDGEMAGTHPVLLFVRQDNVGDGHFIKQLVGFESVDLDAGEKREIEFVLNPCEHLSRANDEGLMVIEEGTRFLVVGDTEYAIDVVL